MNKRILVLGGSGMLGHTLVNILEMDSSLDVYNLVRGVKINEKSIKCDVLEIRELKNNIDDLNPDFIINCIGILREESDQNFDKAIYINSFLPQWLLNYCSKTNIKFFHISTDCVFDGLEGGYTEESIPNAKDKYGKTKSLGEFDSKKHLCIRTSIIGPELKENGKGLLHWLFNQKGEILGYNNVYWSGVTTVELSKAILFSIKNNITGLWNFTNNKKISKYELLNMLIIEFNLSHLSLNKDFKNVTDKSLTSERKINYEIPPYNIMINQLKEYIEEYNSTYKYQLG